MWYGIVGLLVLVLDIIAIVDVLSGSGSVAHKVLWTLIILVFPIVGMLLYFLLGRETVTV